MGFQKVQRPTLVLQGISLTKATPKVYYTVMDPGKEQDELSGYCSTYVIGKKRKHLSKQVRDSELTTP